MERLKDILQFNTDYPLLFTQLNFWIFFAILYTGYCIVHKQLSMRSLYLMLVSLFFYYKTAGLFVSILIFSTINEYFVGRWLYEAQQPWKRKLLLIYTLVINLGILAWFKYAYFFTDAYNQMFDTQFEVINVFGQWANGFFGSDYFRIDKIILPAGISFYTFQSVSYALDIYRKEITPVKNITDFGFFITFFPQLVAGPIVRASEFIPQIRKPFSLTQTQFGLAVFIILKGLIKKIMIADYLAVNFIDRVMQDPAHFSGFENMCAMFAYSLQVYCDFSGYTDMAIGIALLMGFHLPQNFNAPYKAKNVGEFWKRWHITLSRFLKDYLYIPLGGNKKGTPGSYICLGLVLLFFSLMLKMYYLLFVFMGVSILLYFLARLFPSIKNFINRDINLLLTMVIGGLWHGASMNFLIWGGLNGIALIIYKYWKKISPYENKNTKLIIFWRIFFTFTFITFTRIFFRAPDFEKATEVMQQIFRDFHPEVAWHVVRNYWSVFAVMAAGFIMHWLPSATKGKIQDTFILQPLAVKVVITTVTVFIIYQSVSSKFVPFIYFQF
ncbi:MAG: MBOAT family protein [Chitinophagales bacterium]|nr:MBOAT family protein [Chitinophagales bacterium]